MKDMRTKVVTKNNIYQALWNYIPEPRFTKEFHNPAVEYADGDAEYADEFLAKKAYEYIATEYWFDEDTDYSKEDKERIATIAVDKMRLIFDLDKAVTAAEDEFLKEWRDKVSARQIKREREMIATWARTGCMH